LILGFALLGLFFSGWASYVHYRLLTEPNYVSPCDINATFNCSELYLSRFGSVGGVSVAVAGVLFFTVIALIAGLGQARGGADDAAASYVFALSTVALAMVLYLGWASWFVLRKWCPLCIGTYVGVIGLFIVSGASAGVPMRRLPGRLASDLAEATRSPARLAAVLFAVMLGVLLVGFFPHESVVGASATTAAASPGSGADRENFEKLWGAQPRTDLGVPAGDAKVVILKFNDWQCPACKASYYAYKPILAKYQEVAPGAIKYVTKDYPLNSRCNFTMTSAGHSAACEASVAVRLAVEHGKGDDMVEWLFSHQETLTPQAVEAQVKTLLGVDDFAGAYARLIPDIKRDVADGAALHVQYTPTYYINGVKAQTPDGGFIASQYLEWALEYELKKGGVTLPKADQ
jgi:vitamin-K-epoxide reductase (warfarin-sensitive)